MARMVGAVQYSNVSWLFVKNVYSVSSDSEKISAYSSLEQKQKEILQILQKHFQ